MPLTESVLLLTRLVQPRRPRGECYALATPNRAKSILNNDLFVWILANDLCKESEVCNLLDSKLQFVRTC